MLPQNVDTRPAPVRCAIYTRKSTEEGLDQSFNSLEAQRDAAQAYISSQQAQGWALLPDIYDDGGFTGANMERPALARLLKDIEAGRIDCVVVYKVDRLSRSLLDFARIIGVFEKHGVTFVSVTQQFHTSTPVGRPTCPPCPTHPAPRAISSSRQEAISPATLVPAPTASRVLPAISVTTPIPRPRRPPTATSVGATASACSRVAPP